MSSPLVSVIMAVYNCEKFIKESLYSIKNQTFKDFEIILYDDGSTDKTYKIAEEILYASGLRYSMGKSLTGANIGCGQARNKAIEFASGKYLFIQDGDDSSYPHRLRKEVEFLEGNSNIFCVSALADVMDEKGRFLEFYTYPPSAHKNIKKDMFERKINPIIDPASMFRRNVFEKLGGYDIKWRLVPDFNLWMRAMLEGYRFANIGQFLVHYRKHENSNTTKYNSKGFHTYPCIEKIIREDPEPRELVRLSYVAIRLDKDWSEDEIIDEMESFSWVDYDEELSRKKINYINDGNYYPLSCKSMKDLGWCPGVCEFGDMKTLLNKIGVKK